MLELFPGRSVFAMDGDASVSDYHDRVSNINVWSPIFVLQGSDGDDTIISFFNKLNEAKLGDS